MQYFFEPRSVVLVGVTRASGAGAYNNLEMMLRYGYQGRIYVVHPEVAEILGHKTYSQVGDLPEVPDLAVISVGRENVLPVFAACVEHGIRHVVVISQGFADADRRGRRLQTELQALAQAGKVRVVGPNTLGIVNAFNGFSHRLYGYSSRSLTTAPHHCSTVGSLPGWFGVFHRDDLARGSISAIPAMWISSMCWNFLNMIRKPKSLCCMLKGCGGAVNFCARPAEWPGTNRSSS